MAFYINSCVINEHIIHAHTYFLIILYCFKEYNRFKFSSFFLPSLKTLVPSSSLIHMLYIDNETCLYICNIVSIICLNEQVTVRSVKKKKYFIYLCLFSDILPL
jgi:hypothetical protein